MNFGSVCSGIEAASVAFGPLGWKAQWFSEIEPFPCAVLAHHYPDVPNLGDMTRIHNDERFKRSNISLLCGGTPCQSFSIAGLRKGLDDPRGNLALEFLRIAEISKPKWILWENVPGAISSWSGSNPPSELQPEQRIQDSETSDFGCFLEALREIGYGYAYRILDAQYSGVPQRRRRIFVVGYLGDWRPPAAVLFEPESLCGDIEKGRESGKEIASTITGGSTTSRNHGEKNGSDRDNLVVSTSGAGFWKEGFGPLRGREQDSHENLVCGPLMNNLHGGLTGQEAQNGHIVMAHGQGGAEILAGKCPTLSCNHEVPIIVNTLKGEGFDASEDGTGRQNQVLSFDHRQDPIRGPIPGPLGSKDMGKAIMYENPVHDSRIKEVDVAPQLNAKAGTGGGNLPIVFEPGVMSRLSNKIIRRLTPLECERLQGFPDKYTAIPYKNKPAEKCADGPRYKALGNSWAVPCVAWIGRRIQMFEDIQKEIGE
jgi:DNA (cytosine-5)-methyltransferase 1